MTQQPNKTCQRTCRGAMLGLEELSLEDGRSDGLPASVNLDKDWPLKKETKIYSRISIEKISEFQLFFYLHFL
jgi:hypothetical protein